MEKKEARAKIKRRIAGLTQEQKVQKSSLIKEKLFDLPEFKKSQTIMFFLSMSDEVITFEMIRDALREGKRIVAPRTILASKELVPCELLGLSDVARGAYDILEPVLERPLSPDKIDMVLVPARGFDLHGNRLGRGAGFYDRFMAQPSFQAVKCGVAFDVQILDDLPHDEHDLPVDILITESKILRFCR